MPVIDLKKLREEDKSQTRDDPFRHQAEAIRELTKALDLANRNGKNGLLVLPTGAGKTFTAVKFLGDEALPYNIRVLWLAHSFHLLDQAYAAFCKYAKWIRSRDTINIRVISSNPSHEKAFAIEPTDDVVIMTTQTAIRNLHTTAEDAAGNRVRTKFRHFLQACNDTGLLVVLDEAHHAPAFGCRNLLIGDKEPRIGIQQLVPSASILGLTATPTYTDESRSGWLRKIFGDKPIYRTDNTSLIHEKILARPNFIEKPTGREFTVPDVFYNRIVREHTDLPQEIVEKLASDAARNDFIVQEYVENRKDYGKTIIFADRWFQCRYMMNKLREHGVRADVVYHHIDADPGSIEARNQRTQSDNSRVIHEFKYGRDADGRDSIEVLINVRMLTEGTDVPSVKTVFITRQTTSSILMTQMIGRALRGRKAGGHDEAKVVLFVDDWKRLIDWAAPIPDGGLGGEPVIRGHRPLEYISERLIDRLSSDILLPSSPGSAPFLKLLPVGWYETELTIATSEENFDEMQTYTEFVMVYEHTKAKFDDFIAVLPDGLEDEWANEYLKPEWMQQQAGVWIDRWFHRDSDDIGNTLGQDVIRVARHLAQRGRGPAFHSFDEREQYDLDELARQNRSKSPVEWEPLLEREFTKPGSLWKTFYKLFDNFKKAFYLTMVRAIGDPPVGVPQPPPIPPTSETGKQALSEEEREQLFRRDDYTCLSCGARGRGVKLQPDHIIPYSLGGETTVDNSQTLCSICNNRKGINEINFRNNVTSLETPRELQLLPRYRNENATRTFTRLVNFFYRSRAICHLKTNKRSTGKHYARWKVELYAGNNPEWLLQYKPSLIEYLQIQLDCPHVVGLEITVPGWEPPREECDVPVEGTTGGSKKAGETGEDENDMSSMFRDSFIVDLWNRRSDRQ